MTKSLLLVLLIGLAACSRIHIPAPPDINSGPPDYEDLRPGGVLRVVIPLLTSRNTSPISLSEQANGTTISLSASNLIGYQTLNYSINGKRGGRVQLKFASAELTKKGVSRSIPELSALPFLLPRKAGYIRLLYLQRLSESDHNMAILVSKQLDNLNTLTMQVRKDPTACLTTHDDICSWVPEGVAVRPEARYRK